MRPIAAYDFTFINVTTFDNVDVRHVLCEQHVDLFLAKRRLRELIPRLRKLVSKGKLRVHAHLLENS